MSKTLLSVVTVCYNSEKTIETTINSILNQTFTNFEYIIIDGNSSDNTVKIITSFKDKFIEKGISFTWISEKDTGIYNAFNKGLNLVKTGWVSFLGSDDYYKKNALEIYANVILKIDSNVDFVFSNVDVIDEKGKIVKKINSNWYWSKFKRYMDIAHVGAFHHKQYFLKYGFFNESFKISGDYELLLRAKSNLKTIKIEKNTAIMSNEGVSNNQAILAFNETFKAKYKTANISILSCFLDYIIALFKYYSKKILREIIR
ncbi:glycosyltransferase family 2 protein [Polaribacter sp. SA4-12]|uniref:glycosyltransferase family 2 protein n=1 Tax=Polaribacter sp. SA4-12 TaxID=1312072 RepID=UPI000B3C0E5E|nr:glycosyltransferase family 2 protein [Polaribacter sp. SA4-12]ARV15524.1 hypothetical protein BTO07_10405 [Polaribacter sp. SA4-12]